MVYWQRRPHSAQRNDSEQSHGKATPMTNPELRYVEATENSYLVHVFVDGDETVEAFTVHAGKDYANGDDLCAFLRDRADTVLAELYRRTVDQVELTIRCPTCDDDLAAGVAYRW